VYDVFPTSQLNFKRRRGESLAVTAFNLAVIRAFKSGSKMRRNRQRSLVFGLVTLGLAILGMLTLAPLALGQSSSAPEAGIPVPTDWSHHHVIFSRPATTEQAARIEKDPRYWQQRYRSQLPAMLPAAENRDALARESGEDAALLARARRKSGYWAESLGAGGTVGADNYPAKFSFFGSTANCGSATQPDFVVYSTGLAGSPTQASIVAYDNIYSGCSGTVPQVYWAYDTGGQILTSPTFSLDGTQVAFVETNGGIGILVLLKWAASSGESITSPVHPTLKTPAQYVHCTAPCMTEIFLEDGSGTQIDDTTSSVFVDYTGDTAWVGGAFGWLHKINPIFDGIPAEVRSGGFPVQVNSATLSLSNPVHDYASGSVFVGDADGFLYRVNPTTAAVTTSGQLDYGTGIVDTPEVDSTAGFVYVFASSDGSATCAGGAACAAVYQLSSNFSDGDTGSEEIVGSSVVFGDTPNPMYDGDFDSAYKNSTTRTGNLYVCGNTGGPPVLYRIPITAGVMGEVNTGPFLSTSNVPCSPVTDILNPNASGGATEWIFAGVVNGGEQSPCASGGCVMNFINTSWLPGTHYSVGQEILDTNLHIEVVKTAGTSGGAVPTWAGGTGAPTLDGTVTWLDQGSISTTTPGAWVKNHRYGRGSGILDPNGNIEVVTSATGFSGGTIPTFGAAPGATTADGAITWTNLGAIATAALPSAGGSSLPGLLRYTSPL
jgi:hypothetical protein